MATTRRRSLLLSAALLALLLCSAPAWAQEDPDAEDPPAPDAEDPPAPDTGDAPAAPAAGGPKYETVPEALAAEPQLAHFWAIVQHLGLQNDKMFMWKQLQGTLYIPTEEAFKKYLDEQGKSSVEAWLADAAKDVVTKVVYQHIVPSYQLGSFNNLYEGQKQPSVLTILNHRSKLTVNVVGKDHVLTAEKSTAKFVKPQRPVGAGYSRIWLVDAVLLPDLEAEDGALPDFTKEGTTVFNVVSELPGLEDVYAAIKDVPELVTLLDNPDLVATVNLPNNFALASAVKATGLKPADLLFNQSFIVPNIKYVIFPDVVYTSEQLATMGGKTIPTALADKPVRMTAYTTHIVLNGDVENGKLVHIMPKHPKPLLEDAPDFDKDLPVGKAIVHVIDGWPVVW